MGRFNADRPVVKTIPIEKHLDQREIKELALNQCLRKRIFNVLLQCPPQWPGSIRAIGAGLNHNPLLRFVSQPYLKAVPDHCPVNLVDLQLNNIEQLMVEEFIEDDDFIESINKFRVECLPNRRHH